MAYSVIAPKVTEIKFLTFDTSSLTNAAQLFRNCISLTSVDISNLNIQNINSLNHMFYNCNSLKYINLFNFDTSNIKEMNKMFENCKDLTSIDLSNFDTSKVTIMDYLFYNCEKLEYINLFNFRDDSIQGKTNMFSRIAKNTVICIDENKAPSIYNLIVDNFPCVVISCNSDWRNVQKKIIKETGECCDNCPDNTIPINNICYSNEEICDSNCKTCNISETIPSTICSSCYENKFLKNGKCVDSCENDYYSDEIDPTIKICKCDIPKCEKCSSESISNNLCLSCNNEKGYYPLLNDINNIDDFIECYTGDITGYYLDNNDNYYKQCYNTCSKCSSNGDENNHNCNECKEGYDLIIRQDLYSNCEPKCYNSYHYFNQENKYICLNSLICPENYNKLIEELGECIDDCSKISNYQYEFRKKCYNQCPEDISYVSNDKQFYCEVKCNKASPLEKVEEQICTNFCGIKEMENDLCISKYKDEGDNDNLILFNIKKDIISVNFDKSYLYKNENDIIIEEGKTKFTITKYNKIKNDADSSINLVECENKLMNKYNLDYLDNFIILKINSRKNGNINDKVGFEMYAELNENNILTKLDMNICNGIFKNNEISKCDEYSIESFLDDSCITCNDNYFPIDNENLNQNKNSFFKCGQLKEYLLSTFNLENMESQIIKGKDNTLNY